MVLDPEKYPWFLRRADQVAVATLVIFGLASIGAWLISHSWPDYRLIEFRDIQPRNAQFLVDVNKAEWSEFTMLPNVGEVMARRIVQDRKENGPFVDHQDLLRIRGIGPKTLARISPYLRAIGGGSPIAGQERGVSVQ